MVLRRALCAKLLVLMASIAAGAVDGGPAAEREVPGDDRGSIQICLLGQSIIEHDVRADPVNAQRLSSVKALLKDADVVFSNLEVAIDTGPEPWRYHRYQHTAKPVVLDCLAELGINMMSLSNNHTMDLGPGAVQATLQETAKRGLTVAGLGANFAAAVSPGYRQVQGRQVALIASSLMGSGPAEYRARSGAFEDRPGINLLDFTNEAVEQANLAAIREADANADIVIVYQHFQGRSPRPQVEWARRCIEAGADLYLGDGSTEVKGMAFHQGKPLFLDLGTFFFHSNKTPEKRGPYAEPGWRSALVRLEWQDDGWRQFEVFPLVVNRWGTEQNHMPTRGIPTVATAELGGEILDDIVRMSEPLGTQLTKQQDRLLGQPPGEPASDRSDADEAQQLQPPFRTLDVDIGEQVQVRIGEAEVALEVQAVTSISDPVVDCLIGATVRLVVDGQTLDLPSAACHLPRTVGAVQIDCPITRAHYARSNKDRWALAKDVRLRLWPAGRAWLTPGTFAHPMPHQRAFTTTTQMANAPVLNGTVPGVEAIYYHSGLDFGGCEGLDEVCAAADGVIVGLGEAVLSDQPEWAVRPRSDVINLRDDRGWIHRYSHLASFDPAVRLGDRITIGQPLGRLGKEGSSGGWSHLHFSLATRMPSGEWGEHDAYPFVWEAYRRRHDPSLIAVAKPERRAWVGEEVTLDGSLSWARDGAITRHTWFLDRCDAGDRMQGEVITRRYDQPGLYTEILRVENAAGERSHAAVLVQVFDRRQPRRMPTYMHAAYHPTLDITVGQPVTFVVRSLREPGDGERWDFGDGSPMQTTRSEPQGQNHPRGYARVTHTYERPGSWFVSATTTNRHGFRSTARLVVEVASAR